MAARGAVNRLLAGDQLNVSEGHAIITGHLLVFSLARGIDLAGNFSGVTAIADHTKVTVGLLAQLAAGSADMASLRFMAIAAPLPSSRASRPQIR